jgi:hypothetical protein
VHLTLRYVNLVVSIEVAVECAVVPLYLVVKQRLKCNTGKVCNCLMQFSFTMVLSVDFQHLLYVHSDFPNALYIRSAVNAALLKIAC